MIKKLFEFIFGKKKPVEQAVAEAVLTTKRLRDGMWIVHEGKVGIIVKQTEDGIEIHYVDGKGETIGRNRVPACDLVQAMLKDIPSARRPDTDMANKLGYR